MKKWYDVKLPSNIVSRSTDNVSYEVVGNKTQKNMAFNGQACYYTHMQKLPQYTFKCVPAVEKSILPEKEYLLWMQYCHAFGLTPMGSSFWTENGRNFALIPGKYEPRHRVYTGLCCYRWADSLAPLPYTVVHIMEQKPELHFLQVLHYAMGKFVTLVGHSFTSVMAQSMSLYGNMGANVKSPRLDLVYGLGMKLFFQFDEKGICPSVVHEKINQTNVAIDTYVASLKLSLKVKKHEELLDEKWTPFYYFDRFDKKLCHEFYDQHK